MNTTITQQAKYNEKILRGTFMLVSLHDCCEEHSRLAQT